MRKQEGFFFGIWERILVKQRPQLLGSRETEIQGV